VVVLRRLASARRGLPRRSRRRRCTGLKPALAAYATARFDRRGAVEVEGRCGVHHREASGL
jgi:hypothetical protein